jgi:hypothetical protein
VVDAAKAAAVRLTKQGASSAIYKAVALDATYGLTAKAEEMASRVHLKDRADAVQGA